MELDFSFRRDISQIRGVGHSTISSSLPKDFSTCGLSLNNTSRFEEKKALRKLKEQDLLNRMYFDPPLRNQKLKCFNDNEKLVKKALEFRPVKTKKSKNEKENKE